MSEAMLLIGDTCELSKWLQEASGHESLVLTPESMLSTSEAFLFFSSLRAARVNNPIMVLTDHQETFTQTSQKATVRKPD